MKIQRSILALMVAATVGIAAASQLVRAEEAGHSHETPSPSKQRWSFAGPFGQFDQAQLQRGFKVYREVCQTCHSLSLVSFRNLADPGGPGFTAAQAEAVAAEYQVPGDPDDQGEVKDRPARLADHFPPPFKNDNQ